MGQRTRQNYFAIVVAATIQVFFFGLTLTHWRKETEARDRALKEGAPVMCHGHIDRSSVYRYTGGELRQYPSEGVASSWDPTWGKFVTRIDCVNIPKGAPMSWNARNPVARALKSFSEHAVDAKPAVREAKAPNFVNEGTAVTAASKPAVRGAKAPSSIIEGTEVTAASKPSAREVKDPNSVNAPANVAPAPGPVAAARAEKKVVWDAGKQAAAKEKVASDATSASKAVRKVTPKQEAAPNKAGPEKEAIPKTSPAKVAPAKAAPAPGATAVASAEKNAAWGTAKKKVASDATSASKAARKATPKQEAAPNKAGPKKRRFRRRVP